MSLRALWLRAVVAKKSFACEGVSSNIGPILSPRDVPRFLAAPWPWGRRSLVLTQAAFLTLTILFAAIGQWFLGRDAGQQSGVLFYAAGVASLLATVVLQRKTAISAPVARLSTRPLPLAIPTVVLAQLAAAALIFTDSPLLLVATVLWLASIVLAVGIAVRASWPDASPRTLSIDIPRSLALSRLELLGLVGVMIAGAALRLVSLDAYPSGIHGDEAEFGLLAISVLKGDGPNPFGTAFLGDPALFTWIEAPLVQVFGPTMPAVRALAAVTGTLTLLPFYALTRAMFGSLSAVLGTAFLAGAAIAVHFSRLALNVPEVLLFSVLSFYCLWRGYWSGRAAWWLLSGLAAGTALYFHFTGRLVPLAIGLFMLYLLATRRTAPLTWLRQVALLCAGAVLVLMPMAAYLAPRSYQFVQHMDSRLVFQEWGRVASQYGTSDPLPVYWGQLVSNLSAFINRQDASQFYTFTGAPLLNGVTAALFVIGLALTIVRLRDPRYAMLFLWFLTFVIVGGVLTLDSPQFHRLLPAVLPALIVVAVALEWIVAVWVSLLGRSMAVALSAVALLVPVASGVYDAHMYVGANAQAYPWADTTMQARYIASLGSGYQVFVAGVPYTYASHGATRYLAGSAEARDLSNLPVQLTQPPLGRPLAILVNPALESWLPDLEMVYPTGKASPVALPNGHVVFTAFVVPDGGTGGWTAGHGLTGQIRANNPGSPVWMSASPVVAFRDIGALVPGGQAPFVGEWRGTLNVPQPGSYALELWTDGTASLTLDDQAIIRSTAASDQPRSLTQSLNLSAGLHPIAIEDQFPRSPGMVELYWQGPGGVRTLIPADNLLPS